MKGKIIPGQWLFNRRLIDKSTGCWNWTGHRQNRGYGHVYFLGKLRLVHRLAAHLFLGVDLNTKNDVMHKCDNPACFNPQHLMVGTRADNMEDAKRKGRLKRKPRIHCKYGHKLSGHNEYVAPDGRRRCRFCRNLASTLSNTLR